MLQYLMEGTVGPMMVLGVFGNLNVIVAVARKKVLRTKGALLVFVLAIAHLICNVSELRILFLRFRFQSMKGRKCFEYNIPYSLAIMFQSALFLSMALDLCFCIVIPIKHMLWPKTRYILVMCIMPTCFSAVVFGLNLAFVTNENAPYCAFMLTMDDDVFEFISSSVVLCNTLTLLITVVSVLVAVKKSQEMRDHRHSTASRRNSAVDDRRKVFRSTFYMMSIYMVSWMTSSLCFRILLELFDDETEIIEYMPYLTIITMPNFCQAYFVTYLRSPRFRKAYREHFHWISCGLLYPSIFEQPEVRGNGESGSKHDSATNQLENEKKEKKTVRIAAETF